VSISGAHEFACRRAQPQLRRNRDVVHLGGVESEDLPELAKPNTVVIVRDVDLLPAWAAERLRDLVLAARRTAMVPVAITAERFEDVPGALIPLIDTVVWVPPLRDRPSDVLTLAAHLCRRARGRDVTITPAAARALQSYGWPGNVEQLGRVIVRAATASDIVDIGDLPVEVLAGNTQRLSRIETFERAEIVRVLSRSEVTMNQAARELGMSRATLYRKVSQYGIKVR
jgi:transcriptional regulator with AAA-type ATPase domain